MLDAALRTPAPPVADLSTAVRAMLSRHTGNPWFLNQFWPESRDRILSAVRDALTQRPPGPNVQVLDIGCYNGFLCHLFRLLGYEVTGTDSYPLDGREEFFDELGMRFVPSNANELHALRDIPDAAFDVVFMGEIVEHILNHPLGFMKDVARVTRPGGVLILTTPNPSTFVNAVRTLLDRPIIWGTREFMDQPKLDGTKVISYEALHYREYRTSEVVYLLTAAGFHVEKVRYLGMGVSRNQPFWKRLLKANPLFRLLSRHRLFGCTHYFLARRAQETHAS